jgi:hypothetical protein
MSEPTVTQLGLEAGLELDALQRRVAAAIAADQPLSVRAELISALDCLRLAMRHMASAATSIASGQR